MIENFAYSHVSKPGQVRPGYVGAPYPDVEHRINEDGEIEVKSPGTMQGYYKRPEENQLVFIDDGFLRTGDLGVIDETGRLNITGRAKELFKTSKGKYVAPAPSKTSSPATRCWRPASSAVRVTRCPMAWRKA